VIVDRDPVSPPGDPEGKTVRRETETRGSPLLLPEHRSITRKVSDHFLVVAPSHGDEHPGAVCRYGNPARVFAVLLPERGRFRPIEIVHLLVRTSDNVLPVGRDRHRPYAISFRELPEWSPVIPVIELDRGSLSRGDVRPVSGHGNGREARGILRFPQWR